MQELLLVGFGGHAKSVIDSIIIGNQYHIYGALDQEKKIGDSYQGCYVIGDDSNLQQLYDKGIRNAFVTIGFLGKNDIRKKIYEKLKKIGFHIPAIIDPSVKMARDVLVEEGAFVGKNAVVNAQAIIKKMSIINTGAIVEHECKIGSYSHVAIGSIISGNVMIGSETLIGAGGIVLQGVHIGEQSIVGAGSVVIHDVPRYCTVVGNPARIVKQEN